MSDSKLIFIVVGPSGAGKSSFVDRIITEIDIIEDAITNTTREMRAGESHGNPYDFVSVEEFKNRLNDGLFIEWAEVHGNLYGTPKSEVERISSNGHAVIMDIDVQGAKTFKKLYPEAITLFILPPSTSALRKRVVERDGDSLSEKQLEVRMSNAKKEIELASTFDHQIVNDEFESSYHVFKKLVEGYLKKL